MTPAPPRIDAEIHIKTPDDMGSVRRIGRRNLGHDQGKGTASTALSRSVIQTKRLPSLSWPKSGLLGSKPTGMLAVPALGRRAARRGGVRRRMEPAGQGGQRLTPGGAFGWRAGVRMSIS